VRNRERFGELPPGPAAPVYTSRGDRQRQAQQQIAVESERGGTVTVLPNPAAAAAAEQLFEVLKVAPPLESMTVALAARIESEACAAGAQHIEPNSYVAQAQSAAELNERVGSVPVVSHAERRAKKHRDDAVREREQLAYKAGGGVDDKSAVAAAAAAAAPAFTVLAQGRAEDVSTDTTAET
jgi:hypothetical protein